MSAVMENEQNKVNEKPHRVRANVMKFVIAFVILALAIYSNIHISSTLPGAASTAQPQGTNNTASASASLPQETNSSTPATGEIQATITPTLSNYSFILLFERSADLIVTFLEQVQAGQISLGDTSARYPYTYAFTVAMETYNQTTPPAELSDAWRSVTTVATEYNKVYTILLQGKPISSTDLYNLKAFRQILVNYQRMLEVNLTNHGISLDVLSAEQQKVEQLLQEKYGDIPVPTRVP